MGGFGAFMVPAPTWVSAFPQQTLAVSAAFPELTRPDEITRFHSSPLTPGNCRLPVHPIRTLGHPIVHQLGEYSP